MTYTVVLAFLKFTKNIYGIKLYSILVVDRLTFDQTFQMSLLPYDLDDMYQDLQHFSLGVPTSDLYSMPMHGGCLRPRRRLHYLKPKVSSVANDKDGFKVRFLTIFLYIKLNS